MADPMLRVLVIEDGTEYLESYERFLPEGFTFHRAGSGVEALALLRSEAPFDAIVLDMRFDRAPEGELLGDVDEVAERFNGDLVQARQFLEDHQGTFILAALREAGCALPVLLSCDFSTEPRRWARLTARYAPVGYVPDEAGPTDVGDHLRRLAGV
jgi:CheY-like chemotaxis protein